MAKNVSEVFIYDPSTGVITWKISSGKRAKRGKKAGGINNKGYVYIRYDKQPYLGHRLAWFLFYKEWPEMEIDHINGDRTDNRIENLRVVTRSQNQHNRKGSNLTSQYKGVYWKKSNKCWVSQISYGGAKFYLGKFNDEKEAAVAYDKKATELFGEYARTNFGTS